MPFNFALVYNAPQFMVAADFFLQMSGGGEISLKKPRKNCYLWVVSYKIARLF